MPADIDETDPDQRIIEAWEAIRDSKGVAAITGWAALRWLGARWFDGTADGGRRLLPVPVLTTSRLRSQAGLQVTEERPAHHLFEHDGLQLTDPLRSLIYEARYAPSLRQAVVHIEMAAYSDLVSIEEPTAELPHYNGWTGVGKPRRALAYVDENVWSPQEAGMKFAWSHDLGFPLPLCNQPIFDLHGRHVATPDLFDPVAGIAGEYDGAFHLEGEQRRRDRDREEAMRDLDIEYFTVLAGDLGTGQALERMANARRRARFLPPDQRRWSTVPPQWWIPTTTVAQRRALGDADRQRLLTHRLAG